MKCIRRIPGGFLLTIACWLFITLSGCKRTTGPTSQIIERPIDFLAEEAIEGADLVIRAGGTILIGEIHGTWEIPIVVASLVRLASDKGLETVLCIELSGSEQSQINDFVSSDGGPAAVHALLSGPHWNNPHGLASVGMFAMLELIRTLHAGGESVRVIAMDLDEWFPQGELLLLSTEELSKELALRRDSHMAQSVIQARKESPDALFIVFAGNVHTNVNKGAPWDDTFDTYVPMGHLMIQKIPDLVSLNVETAGRETWSTTDQSSGPTMRYGKDCGDRPFIEMNVNADSGYHGRLYVGPVTAAKPAVVNSGENRSDVLEPCRSGN